MQRMIDDELLDDLTSSDLTGGLPAKLAGFATL